MQQTKEKYIELVPGNWLYNASVIGFINSLEMVEKIDVEDYFENDGRIVLEKDIFQKLEVEKRYFSENKISSIVGNVKTTIYKNYINPSRKYDKKGFPLFIKELSNVSASTINCSLCSGKFNFTEESIKKLDKNWGEKKDFANFYYSIIKFKNSLSPTLGGAISEFPNGFWNLNESTQICPVCSFFIIHHHISLTEINSKFKQSVFVNAPSFKIMYHLNKILNQLISGNNVEKRNKRDLLAMSIIEMSAKTNILLGKWSGMNIEIISQEKKWNKEKVKYDTFIDNFVIAYETTKLLSDRNIAGLLSNLGEFSVLNMILDKQYDNLINLGTQLLKLSIKAPVITKSENKNDYEYLNTIFYNYRNWNSSQALVRTANKLFKIYAFINKTQKY